MKRMLLRIFSLIIVLTSQISVSAQTAMQNVYGRKAISLNGKWNTLADWICNGDYRKVWEERTPTSKTDFVGVCPWILYDYLSLCRMHPVYQNGFNRKVLVDEHGNRKQAFYIMQHFYNTIEK